MPTSSPPRSPALTAVITVSGTPVTLSLSAASVLSGSTFTATVTVIGNGATGNYPNGTATIYAVASGSTTASLSELLVTWRMQGTIPARGRSRLRRRLRTWASEPMSSTRSTTRYQRHAIAQGSSSDEPLTVITVTPTSTSDHLRRRIIWRHLHIHDNCDSDRSTCSSRFDG